MSAFFELHEAATDGIDIQNDRKWRKEQLRKLWLVICMAFTGETGKGKRWRMIKCYQIFRKRFWRMQECAWIPFIAGLSDHQVIGDIQNPRIQKDLYQVRNTAIYACHLWNLRPI